MLTRDVHDPGVGFVTLTRVEVTPGPAARAGLLHDARRPRRRARRPRRRCGGPRRSSAASSGGGCACGACPTSSSLRQVGGAPGARGTASAGDPRGRERAPDQPSHDPDDDQALNTSARRRASRRGDPATGSGSSSPRTLRPDGDSIGSQMAMAYALRALGKDVRIVNRDPGPAPLLLFPGVDGIAIAERAEGDFDAVLVMECGDLARTGVQGLEPATSSTSTTTPATRCTGPSTGSTRGAAACGEMVFDVIAGARRAAHARDRDAHLRRDPDRHGIVPLLEHLAAHVRHLPPGGGGRRGSRRPSRAACSTATAGPPEAVRRRCSARWSWRTPGRLAVGSLDRAMAAAAGGTYDDTEGLINLPLTVKEIQAVVFFKEMDRGAVPRQPALEGRRSTSARWPSSSAAAATRTPRAAPSRARCRSPAQVIPRVVEAIERAQRRVRPHERAVTACPRPSRLRRRAPLAVPPPGRVAVTVRGRARAGRRARRRQARGPDFARRGRPVPAPCSVSGRSATRARSTPWRRASCPVLGRATRLAQFLSGAEKHYDARSPPGSATDTYDRTGAVLRTPDAGGVAMPGRNRLRRCAGGHRRASTSRSRPRSPRRRSAGRARTTWRADGRVVTLAAGAGHGRPSRDAGLDGRPCSNPRLACSAGLLRAGARPRPRTASRLRARTWHALRRTASGPFTLARALALEPCNGTRSWRRGRRGARGRSCRTCPRRC